LGFPSRRWISHYDTVEKPGRKSDARRAARSAVMKSIAAIDRLDEIPANAEMAVDDA
jgi:hypothetical protein